MVKTADAEVMAGKFLGMSVAMTVLNGKVYGTRIGNWKPYSLPAEAATALLAIELGLFKPFCDGEIDGQPVQWWMNRR